MEFDWWSWIIIPTLIFAARLLDVSLATMRHILIFRGHRRIVPAIAFVEVLVWLLAITQVMNNLSNFASYLAWARWILCWNMAWHGHRGKNCSGTFNCPHHY